MAQLDFSQSSFPTVYENTVVGPIFRPWVDTLFEKTSLGANDSVLDVACGTGIVSRTAKEKLGPDSIVVGVDISPGMLALAKSIAPTVDFREGNALDLPLKDGEKFDVVYCSQGIQFFPNRAQAFAEMKRALKPRGRLAVAAWSPSEEVPFYRALQDIVEKHVGVVSDQRYCFGDPAIIEALLIDAEFRVAEAETKSRRVRLPDKESFIRTNANALIGMSAQSASLSAEARAEMLAKILEESAPVARRYADGDGISFESKTVVGWARL